MALPDVVSYDEWRDARVKLLEDEKALTRARDELSTRRRQLPMVRVEKDYRFTGPDGEVRLLDMFEGRSQLVVQHFMFDPAWDDGCPSCTAGADEVADGLRRHLATRDTTHAVIARAPYEKIAAYKAKRGWTFPFYSSFGSDFNYDFHVSLDPAQGPVEYNFRSGEDWAAAGAGWMTEGPTEQPGFSAFLTVDGDVYHTYSTFGRGAEWLGGSYAYLDLTALGRQEDWEEPAGRADSVRLARPDFAT